MTRIEIEPWEPEETIGKLWHAFASRLDAPLVHHGAAVDLSEVSGRLAVFFRGLGGGHAVEIRATPPEVSQHRLRFLRRLGTEAEITPRASFDGEVLRLPDSLALFPSRAANGALYLWLVAAVAHAPAHLSDPDPLRADLLALRSVHLMTAATHAAAPGLRDLHAGLCAATLHGRARHSLPPDEAAIESVIRHMLDDPAPLSPRAESFLTIVQSGDLTPLTAPRGYRPFRPVPLWPDLRELIHSARDEVESRD
ncbi:MAG: nitric oxide reductase D protein, partial [Roseovarius sp.]